MLMAKEKVGYFILEEQEDLLLFATVGLIIQGVNLTEMVKL